MKSDIDIEYLKSKKEDLPYPMPEFDTTVNEKKKSPKNKTEKRKPRWILYDGEIATAYAIEPVVKHVLLELCDGKQTISEIADRLASEYIQVKKCKADDIYFQVRDIALRTLVKYAQSGVIGLDGFPKSVFLKRCYNPDEHAKSKEDKKPESKKKVKAKPKPNPKTVSA